MIFDESVTRHYQSSFYVSSLSEYRSWVDVKQSDYQYSVRVVVVPHDMIKSCWDKEEL